MLKCVCDDYGKCLSSSLTVLISDVSLEFDSFPSHWHYPSWDLTVSHLGSGNVLPASGLVLASYPALLTVTGGLLGILGALGLESCV